MIWSLGKILPPEALHIDVRDETFLHGLGLFETFRTWNGNPTLLPMHLKRLCRSARDLELKVIFDQLPDDYAVHKLIAAHMQQAPEPVEAVRIRIIMSGGRYDPQPHLSYGSVWMTISSLEPPTAGQAAAIKRTMIVAPDDPLARHKTLNYWRKRIAWAEAIREGAHEVLCVTPEGMVCEGTRTNIFLVKGGKLITPGRDGPLLPGIMRRVVLERAERLGLAIVEGRVPFESLERVDEAFLTNSVQGMLPISRLFDRDLPAPGPLTARLWSEILPWLESGGTTR
jgi:branched-subunit amino acid aminotransferase/4-amino-4-deoxychorismate lyase